MKPLPGMSVAIYSPKGKKLRGRAVVESVDEYGKNITFKQPLPFKVRKGDTLVIAQGSREPIQ